MRHIIRLLALPLTMLAGSAESAPGNDMLIGQVGQRQSRKEASPNFEPMERVANRVTNRVESRMRTRLDRYYDPRANSESPFKVAGEQARVAGRITRR